MGLQLTYLTEPTDVLVDVAAVVSDFLPGGAVCRACVSMTSFSDGTEAGTAVEDLRKKQIVR